MPLQLSRIRALCFDVDGTLSDTDDHYVARLSAALRRLRLTRQPDRLARRLVMGLESPVTFLMGLADQLTVDDELIGLISWLNRYAHRPTRAVPAIPGVRATLDRLRANFPMAVVSARDEAGTLAFLEQAGMRAYFEVVVTGMSTPRTKPFPDPVLLAATRLGVEAGSCLMIGDTTVDIRAGRAAGAQTIGVLCGFGERAELVRHGADLVLDSTADLASVFPQIAL